MNYPNGYDNVTLAEGDVANTWEFMFDLNIGTALVPVWLNVPQLTGFNPQQTPKTKDITTYADQGSNRNQKVGVDFALDFNLLKIRDDSGEFQPEWLVLKQAADAEGDANNIECRYYDARGASDAYQGVVSVGRGNRPSTANDDPGFDNFTFSSVGKMTPIANPLLAGTPAKILTILPAGRSVGEQVTISGERLGGATSVKFNNITAAADATTVVGDKIVVTIPATTPTGAVAVTVITPQGVSPAVNYTVVA